MSTRINAFGFAAGRALAQLAVVVRGVVIARLIGPDNMGISATFTALLVFVDMFSSIGADKFLIQDPDGCSPKTARTIHLIGLARGILLSLCVLGAAWPVSGILGTREAVLGYFILALVPLLRGLQNLDWALQQRAHRPKTSVLMVVFAEWSSLAVGVGVAIATRSWWAPVASMLTQGIVLAALSWFWATRRWSVGFDRDVARRAFQFGLPLLLSGVLLFLASQGDRLAVGVADALRGIPTYTLGDLGCYALVANLTLLPSAICGDLAYGVFLPWIARSPDDATAARRRNDLLVLYGILGVAIVFTASTVGSSIVSMLVGPKYGDMHGLIAILGAAQALFILRMTSNMAAMAVGNSLNTLLGCAGRALGLVAAVVAVFHGLPLEIVAGCALLGEVIGLACSEFNLFAASPARAGFALTAPIMALSLLATASLGWYASLALGSWTSFAVLLAGVLLAIAILYLASASIRSSLQGFMRLVTRGHAPEAVHFDR